MKLARRRPVHSWSALAGAQRAHPGAQAGLVHSAGGCLQSADCYSTLIEAAAPLAMGCAPAVLLVALRQTGVIRVAEGKIAKAGTCGDS